MLVARLDLEGVLLNEVEINAFCFVLPISRKDPFETMMQLSMATGDMFGVTVSPPRSFVFESSASIGFEDTHE